MIYWEIFISFFIPGILSYGGGPATIPLIEDMVIDRYDWMSAEEFAQILAFGNSLPGPISTKMAGYIGFEQGGILGAMVGVTAMVLPSLVLMLVLMGLLLRFKDSPRVKKLTMLIRPTIAVMLGIIAYEFFSKAYLDSGLWQTLFLVIISYFLLERFKVHPAFIIAGALGYGALFLSS